MTDKNDKSVIEGIASIAVPCSARKEQLPPPSLRSMNLRKDWPLRVSRQWMERLREASADEGALVAAENLYKGRAFQVARAAANAIGGPLFIISAGLGLVGGSTQVPSYDLTLSPYAEEALQAKLRGQLDPTKWWSAVQSGPYACSMESLGRHDGRILVALTQPYADLIGQALALLPVEMRTRLRIFGGGLGQRLPEEIRPNVIFYDGRLDALNPGTRLDAGARALAHFAELTHRCPVTDVHADQALVEIALNGVTPPDVPVRQRVSDEVLKEKLACFARAGLSASVALRRLRDDVQVACEERRFRRLYEEVVA